ncbi:DUF1775 domain-containing protein [Calidithermus timidus]|jgi:uncharacterized protein YcnI|uniref:DUF1775 domain-containing protein n=1 Tax=Calidithermus timidus TaxID=307124 RepID=UPI000369CEAC|nr:DUF1775 domain-containing protein [Calidithermus timidus]
MRKLSRYALIFASLVLPLALAHAVVRTEMNLAESKVGVSETYRLQVPVERPMATVEIRMIVPEGFVLTRFLQTPGWERSVVKDANGLIKEVTWKGRLEDGEFVRFVFQGRNPQTPGTLVWKVYQKYEDGTVVAWDDSDKEKAPASKVEIK